MTAPWLSHAREGRVRTADIAVHFGVAAGTIRRWAAEDRWQPYGTRRHRYWLLADAQASFEKRHASDADCA